MKRFLVILWLFFLIPVSFSSEAMKITSPDIRPGDYMARKFTCQGMKIRPRLEFIDVPENTKGLAILVDALDAPESERLHWLIFNISPDNFEISEMEEPGVEGKNDFDRTGWEPPCFSSGTMRYSFRAYALDVLLELGEGVSRSEFLKAAEGHIIAEAEMTALYEKI